MTHEAAVTISKMAALKGQRGDLASRVFSIGHLGGQLCTQAQWCTIYASHMSHTKSSNLFSTLLYKKIVFLNIFRYS